MKILAVTGLAREARIARSKDVVAVIGGGNSDPLLERLTNALDSDVRGIISVGIAGALAPLLKPGDCIVASRVVTASENFPADAQWIEAIVARLPGVRRAAFAGTDTILSHMGAKRALFRETGAHAVDMESHVAARFARERNIPFVALRAISDGADRTLPSAALEPLTSDGRPRLGAVLKSVAIEPLQVPDLMRTAREARRAFRALIRCRKVLGPGFACPYLG